MDPAPEDDAPRSAEPAPPAAPASAPDPVPASTFAFAAAGIALFAGGMVLASSGLAGAWSWTVVASAILVAAFVAWRLSREGVLAELARYRPGDVLRGGATGAAIFAACALIVHGIAPNVPALSRDLATLEPAVSAVGRNVAFIAALATGAAEQLLMRGLVQRSIASRAGVPRAIAITALVEALVFLPAGHPTLVVLGLLVGVGAGILQARSERIVPSLIAHLMVAFLLSTFPLHGPR